MDDGPTASDYLAEARRKATSNLPALPDPSTVIPFGKSTQAREGTNDPLSWFIDIITRGESGVTNAIQSSVNRTVETQQAIRKGDIGSALGNLGSEIANKILPLDFLSGMLSTDPEQHRTFSDVMEQSTDKIGSLDPNYRNVQDNVNPVFKGVAGLALDIAGDPLTWIPGIQLAKVGSLIAKGSRLAVKGGKGTLDALSGANKAAKIADDAAAVIEKQSGKIVPTAGKVASTAEEGAQATKSERSALDSLTPTDPEFQRMYAEDPEFRRAYDAHLEQVSKIPTTEGAVAAPELRPRELVAQDIERAAQSNEGQALRDGLDSLGPTTVRDIKRVPGVTVETAKPIPFRTMAEMRGPDGAPIKGWVESVAEAPVEALTRFGSKAAEMKSLATRALAGDAKALKYLRTQVFHKYQVDFNEAKQQGKILGPFFQVVEPTAEKVIKGPKTVLDSVASFHRQVQLNRDELVGRFGEDLVNALSNYKIAANFDKAVSRIKGILDRSIDVTTLRRLSAADKAAIRQIGLDPETIPTGLRVQAQMNPNPLPAGESMAEQVTRIRGEEGLDSEAAQFASNALNKVIFRDLDRANLEKTYSFETDTGVLRTSDQFGVGWGRAEREANTYFLYNLAKSIMEDVNSWSNAVHKVRGKWTLGGAGLAKAKHKKFIEAMRLAERALDQQGVPLTVGVGPNRVPLSLSQIIDVMDSIDPAISHWALFNADTAVPWTNLMDAVHVAVSGGTRKQIETMLRQVTTRHISADGSPKPLRNLMLDGLGRYGRTVLKSDTMFHDLANLIDQSRPLLNQVVADNAEALGRRGIEETLDIVDSTLGELETLFTTPGAMGQLLESIADVSTRATAIATERGMMKSSRDAGEAIAEELIPVGDRIVAKTSIDIAKALDNIEAAEEAQQAAVKISQRGFDDLAENNEFDLSGDALELGDRIENQQNYTLARKVWGVFSKIAKTGKMHTALRQYESQQLVYIAHYSNRLNAIARRGLSTEQLANHLVNARHGANLDDPVTAELASLWGMMFGAGEKPGLIDNAFFRNGNDVAHINALFVSRELPAHFEFNLDEAAKVAEEQNISIMRAASQQVEGWNIDDPLDTLNKMFQAFVFVQGQQTLSQQFLKLARELNAISPTPKPGWQRITNATGKSIMAKYLPENAYFDPDVLQMMQGVDNLLQESMDLKGPLGTFIREVYQPLQQAWKTGMTIPNPTHHARNSWSDASLQFAALGVVGLKRSFNVAAQAIATRNQYDGMDAIAFLQGLEEIPNAGAKVASGKVGDLTADGLFTAMKNRGILLSYKELEQLNKAGDESQGVGAIAKAWEKVHESRPLRVIGKASEFREHYFRLSHSAQFIIQNIDNTKDYKNVNELLDAAAESTRKWHPDGTDMTRPEQYFRLVIPFYAWTRKSMFLVGEAVLTHPGRVMVFPKAQYNLAVAMGVNPDSLADPFPQDQMFPSYMTNQITGPIAEIDGHYYGVNPGFATNDILNDWVGSNPLRTILGSTSPLIRAPFELAAGGQVGTGTRINDASDYIDSQIPLVGPLSRMTGNSVTGSIVSMLQGQGLDPQYQIAQGNKDPVVGPGVSALNWLTGIGAQDMSQQNQINYAELEKRNKAGEQRGF